MHAAPVEPSTGLQRLREAAARQGGVCLSETYSNRDARYIFRCAEGHEWDTQGRQVLDGNWCRLCADQAVGDRSRLSDGLQQLQQAAAARGGVCLSTVYTTRVARYAFRCAQGHGWMSSGVVLLQQGGWCRRCSDGQRGLQRRHKDGLERLQALARERGGVCLSLAYTCGNDAYAMRCAKGHEWAAKGHSLFAGRWCARCAADASRASIADARAIAQARGGRCLSEIYLSAAGYLGWECHRGHTWQARYGNVRNGTWCPQCKYLQQVSNRRSKAAAKYQVSRLNGEPEA